MTFQATLPVLCTLALARLGTVGGVPLAGGLAAALLGFNLFTHVAFVRDGGAAPWRPVDAAIARLEALGIRFCYADGRIAQVVTFESSERILCSDYVGFRNYDFLQRRRPGGRSSRASRSSRIAPCGGLTPTSWRGCSTSPAAGYSRDDVGDYSIFHSFVAPGPVTPIAPAGWVTRASAEPEAARLALDRRVWTRWAVPQRPGQWFEVDLGRPYPVAQLALVAAPWVSDAPEGAPGRNLRRRIDVADGGDGRRRCCRDSTGGRGTRGWMRAGRVDRPDGASAHSLPAPGRDRSRRSPARCGASPSCSSTSRPRRRLSRRPPLPRRWPRRSAT